MDKNRMPTHVAIIMDGNGRWAKRRGLARTEGHRRGVKVIKEIIAVAQELGVKFLTLYAFSTENWKRSRQEVDFLIETCESVLTKELSSMIKNDIRFRHIGRLDGLPESLQNWIKNATALTKDNRKLSLQLAFNYGARLEIVEALQGIVREVQEGKILKADITEKLVSDFLYTRGVPDPDLLIRTSGEMRISNFLLWQICYTELYVTKKHWPDFNRKEFIRAIEDFQKRKRRFGGSV